MPRINTSTTSRIQPRNNSGASREVTRTTRRVEATNSFSTRTTRTRGTNSTASTTPRRAGLQRSVSSPDTPKAPLLQQSINQGQYLRKGENSPTVNELQNLLNRSGSQLSVDGDFGRNTDRALRNFQTQHQLKSDGIVGPATLRALMGTPPQIAEPRTVSRPERTQPTTSGQSNGIEGIQGNFTYANNTRGIATARNTELGKKVETEMTKHLETYKKASQLTGVPADLIAAIHANESQFGTYRPSTNGPEAGFGLDPRHVSTRWGNGKLKQYGLGTWQRGKTNETAVLQSAVIAGEHLKRQAGYAGVTIKPTMNQNELAGAVTGYVQGNRAGNRARTRGQSWLFRPTDPNPYPNHPGGTSIGRRGQTVRVAPSRKKGLLRWDTLLPLIKEKMW